MSALIQSQLGLPINGSRRIGANLKQSRQARQAILSHPGLGRRFFIAAAAETEVTDEPPVDAPATSSNPAAREKRSGGNFRRRNNNQRKPLIGPERTLKLDALEVGKNYEGNVVTVTDFGAFVNVGCETDGLLHISQISVDFVRNVADVISIGQPITVRVINVDTERKKFAVTAIPEGEEPPRRGYSMSGGERGDEGEAGSGRRAPPRQARIQKDSRRSQRRSCPVAVGDTVTGKISGIAPYGVFVEVAEGFTGMLHVSQMKLPEGVEDHVGHLSEGSTVEVRVAGIAKGGEKISLTQKSEEELAVEEKTRTEGLSANVDVPEGSGPMAFLLAKAGITPDMFETRKDVSSDVASTQQHEPVAEEVNEAPVVEEVNEAPVAEEQQTVAAESKGKSASETAGISAGLVKQLREASGAGMMDCKKALAECNGDLEAAKDFLRKKGLASADKKAGRVAADGAVWSYIHAGSRLGVLVELNCETDFVARGEKFKELVNDIAMQIAACPQVTVVSATDVPAEVLERERAIEMEKEDLKSKPDAIREKIVQGRVDKIAKEMALLEQPFIKDTGKSVAEHIKQQIATIGENIQIRRFERYNLGEGIEVAAKGDFAAEVEAQTSAMAAKAAEKKSDKPEEEKAPAEKAQPAVAISAAVVKQLREASGAGMMDCKKALAECNGDLEAAKEYLRKKGLASADKKAGRVAAEGAVGAYIHAGSRLGVLVELNCETDFVARGEKFKELVNDIAMQIAACPQVTVVSATDVPAEVLERERAIEMEKEDLKSKPDAIREKIVQGRVDKIAKEMALLEQPFIKDTGKSVAEHIKEQIATIGENIQIRRFERYVLGEGVEKKVTDFAAEVAAQTGMAM